MRTLISYTLIYERAWDEGEIAQRGGCAEELILPARQAAAEGGHERHRCRHCPALAGSITPMGSLRPEPAGSRRGEGCAPGERLDPEREREKNERVQWQAVFACFTLSREFSPSGHAAFGPCPVLLSP